MGLKERKPKLKILGVSPDERRCRYLRHYQHFQGITDYKRIPKQIQHSEKNNKLQIAAIWWQAVHILDMELQKQDRAATVTLASVWMWELLFFGV